MEVLLTSILKSIPIYFLSKIVPFNYVFNELYNIFARFFSGNKAIGKSNYWSARTKVCLPKKRVVVLYLDPCLMYSRQFMQSCGGYLGHKSIYGLNFYETKTAIHKYPFV